MTKQPPLWQTKLNPIGKSYTGGSVVKNLPASARYARDTGSVSGLGRSPGGRNGNPFHYSCLESPMDRTAWWATAHGISNSQTWLSMHARTHTCAHTHKHIYTLQQENYGKWSTLELSQQRSEEDGMCVDPFQAGSCRLFLWILVPWTSGQETTMRWKKHPDRDADSGRQNSATAPQSHTPP